MENRPQWGTRVGFIMAAAGSAIGLGNIWRFPGVAYENGGGAFFLPYLFALLTAGIPILILEFAIGHRNRSAAPGSFAKIRRGFEGIGWWQLIISFVISVYYAAIIAWALSYTVFSFNLKWGDDTSGFLFGEYLKLADTPGQFGGIVPGVFIPLIIVWAVALFILYSGVKKGIEVANKFMIPTLLVLFTILVIRALTLEGAAEGLNAFFKPNWDTILNGKVWVAAYSQIFFSLSIGFAIMVTYSSYLKKKSDITNNAFITGFANSGFELLAGIGVFSILGFMAAQQGVEVNEVVSKGVGLAFVVFPQIINTLPTLNGLFGFLFFASLVLAGMTSLISIVETYIAGLQEKFGISRTKAVLFGGGVTAIVSIMFSSNGGLYFLDVVDYFINNFGVALAGLVEVIAVAWIARELGKLQEHANGISDIKLGLWWKVCLAVITPIVLGYMMIDNLITNIRENYEGYATWFVTAYGWVVVAAAIVLGFVLPFIKNRTVNARANSSGEVSQ
jgi:NSS family neurotransmitter:Na+ symporter